MSAHDTRAEIARRLGLPLALIGAAIDLQLEAGEHPEVIITRLRPRPWHPEGPPKTRRLRVLRPARIEDSFPSPASTVNAAVQFLRQCGDRVERCGAAWKIGGRPATGDEVIKRARVLMARQGPNDAA